MYIRLPVWKFVVIELSRAMKGANDVEKDQFENFTRAGREFEKGRGGGLEQTQKLYLQTVIDIISRS